MRGARPGRRGPRRDHGRRADAARLQPLVLRLPRGDRARGGAERGVSARRRTISAADTASSASCAHRAASASSSEWERLRRVAPPGPTLKASVPGPYTLSGRLVPDEVYRDRYAARRGAAADRARRARGARRRRLPRDHRRRAVDELLRASRGHRAASSRSSTARSQPVVGRCRLSTHLCFGNYKARAVGPRRYAPMFPAFLDLDVDEIHVEMAEPRVRGESRSSGRSPSAWTSPSGSST